MTMPDLWHGSDLPRERLLPGADGGVHLGTRGQAEMRAAAFLHRVAFSPEPSRTRRCVDRGAGWGGRIADARSRGMTAITYLNRYEGVSPEIVDRVGPDAWDAPDARLRGLAPELEDSWIALDPDDVRVTMIEAGRGLVTLHHGTTERNARDLARDGFRPETWRPGGNCGRPGLLYLSTTEEDARWFSNESGCDVVLRIRVPAALLIADPEDATGGTAVEEMILSGRHGLPAKLATRAVIGPERISVVGPAAVPDPGDHHAP